MALAATKAVLTTWEEFLELPDPIDGSVLELHDGEVVSVAPPKPEHHNFQRIIDRWLSAAGASLGDSTIELYYRPKPNYQFWRADVAFLYAADWANKMTGDDYPILAPPLIVEVLSPSNRPAKLTRQRRIAMAAGTKEFWVVDPVKAIIQVYRAGEKVRSYGAKDAIPVGVIPGARFPVKLLFG
jgi:Uma2 family endonuclease